MLTPSTRARRRNRRELDCADCHDRENCWRRQELPPGAMRAVRDLTIPANVTLPVGSRISRDLSVVSSGALKIVSLAHDGSEAVLDFRLPGDLLPLAPRNQDGAHWQAVTLVETTLCRMVPPAESPAERAATYWRIVAQATCETSGRQTASWVSLPAAERVAWFIGDLAERLPRSAKGDSFELPMSRADIGSRLGLSEESVCRALRQLPAKSRFSIRYRTVVEQR